MTEEKKKKRKKEKWVKFRHRVARNILNVLLGGYLRIKFKLKINKLKEKKKRQYLVIMNHQTAFDQFFMGMAIPGAVYYIASEDIFSKGWVSKVIKYLVAPIPFQKSTADFRAIRNCFKIVREGGTIGFFPEGNRTYSGRTGNIKSSVVALAKGLKLPLVILNIKGGYAAQPRWSDNFHRSSVTVDIARILEYEEFKDMPDDEMYELIKRELYVDESLDLTPLKVKNSAEYMERAIYVCPYCGISEFESKGNTVRCKKCGREILYTEKRQLEGIGFEFPYKSVADWYGYQCDYINSFDLSPYTDTPICTDNASLIEVIVYKKKITVSKCAKIAAYSDRLTVSDGNAEMTFRYEDIKGAGAVGRNKMNFYVGDKLYQLKSVKGDKRLCTLKYMNIYYHAENIRKGDNDEQFLGL